MASDDLAGKWALILGASSGFGAAVARELARAGMNILGVHLDTRATLPRANEVVADIESVGCRAVFFNTNAADARKRSQVLDGIEAALAGDVASHIHLMLHSLAFGALGPFIADRPEDAVTEAQLNLTLGVMANSLVFWVQDLSGETCSAEAAGSTLYQVGEPRGYPPSTRLFRPQRPRWRAMCGSSLWSWGPWALPSMVCARA
jgi:NAD(P)-dependent dehydrogenase (short-subunit alcohol dehydrogenase family)